MGENSYFEQDLTEKQLESFMEDFRRKKKEESGGSATYLAIGTTLYLTIRNGTFFTLQGVLFFLIVSFILAPLLLGSLYYGLLRLMTKLTVALRLPDKMIATLGFIMFVLEIALGIKVINAFYIVVFPR